jgi:hypothetical protein
MGERRRRRDGALDPKGGQRRGCVAIRIALRLTKAGDARGYLSALLPIHTDPGRLFGLLARLSTLRRASR